MGEVYRARDPRLERIVAIKVLPTHLNANPELRARFEREAKAISGLQHPNICVLYDVGSQGDIDFLVMEYLEGETLYARLARKPLTPDEILKIATEVADALVKAHRSGIVHRDLKPGNVMLTKGGAKLMDFGLAKPLGPATGPLSGSAHISSMATMAATMADLASPVTVAGTLIGTVQYMSPEQIQGKEADARSDIFAFGAMLYEMLSGKHAFQGKSQLSLASAILEKDPEPIAALQPLTPPALEQVIRTCLAKDPDDRFQNAHDLKLQLQWISVGGSQVGAPAVVGSRRKKNTAVLTAATIAGWLIAAALAVLLLIYAGRLTSARQPVHTSIEPPTGSDFFSVVDGAPALSPDGLQVAFLVSKRGAVLSPGGGSLYLLRLATGEAASVPGAQGALFPFWSPDGKYVGFFSEGKLRKVPAAGGTVQVICDAPEGRGGSWNEQGTIIFAPRIAGSLQSVSDGGGTPVEITKPESGEQGYTDRDPYFLPDGKHFLFVRRAKDAGSVYAGSLDSSGGKPRDIKQILHSGSNVIFSDGYLFYVKEGALTAQEFDPASLSFKGKPVSIASNIEFAPARNEGNFSVSHNVLLYRHTSVVNRELVWFDLSGKEIDHWGEPAAYLGGKFFAATQTALLSRSTSGGNGYSLWISDVARKTVNRLTEDSDRATYGVVSPDGKDVWISTTTGYVTSLTRKSLSASGTEEKVLDNFNGNMILFDISRDGRYLLFNHQDPKTDFDIYMMDLQGTDLQGEKKLVPVLNGPSAERNGHVSPDGKWLAYVSNETGTDELYVTSFPVPGSRWQVSSGGTSSPGDWSADGKNLRYRKSEKIYTLEVHPGASKPDFSPPKELLSLSTSILDLALLPDDKRILAIRPSGDSTAVPIDFVLNWEQLTH